MNTLLDQLLSVQTVVALCTGIGVIFTIYQNHKIKTNDLHHIEKYMVAIGNATHALLLHDGMSDEAQKLHEAMADAFTGKK
ncbi:hypothetical protein FACS1894110_19850 [Spirochaetia bacterium]|nr:hypothetical protein FACS1894110_19850 [Spirochaetia bacterium]